MPIPSEYQGASLDLEKFLLDAREVSGLATTNQVYTMVQAVLQTFRRRLTILEAIYFAGVLPPILRSIFVADWDINEPHLSFGNRAEMIQEVQSLRADHNLAPDTVIRDVAMALRRNVDEAQLDSILTNLPTAARDFWCP